MTGYLRDHHLKDIGGQSVRGDPGFAKPRIGNVLVARFKRESPPLPAPAIASWQALGQATAFDMTNGRLSLSNDCYECPLPISATVGSGHKVRIPKNEKQTFKPSLRVTNWNSRPGRR